MTLHLKIRATVAASMLLAAIVARIISIFLWPSGSDATHATELAAAAAHPAAWYAATWVEAAAWLLAIPAVIVLIGLARRRGATLAWVGGSALVLGYAMLGCATSSLNAVTGVLAAQPDPASNLQTLDALHASPALMVPALAIELGMLGALLLAIGLALGHFANWALPGVAVLVVLASVVTSDSDSHIVILAGFLPLAALWAWLAFIVLRHGTRPLAALEEPANPPVSMASRPTTSVD
jgi:hypothetical protein